MTEHLFLNIDQLLLDQENPRLDSTAAQSEALAGIIALQPTHFRNLMISIRDKGLDPGDSLYVIRSDADDEDFIVLEGNRRLAALKVLSNPDLLAGTNLKESVIKRLLRETTGFKLSLVEPVQCVRFDERDEANEWIRRRHTGIAAGEGRIGWKPLDIQRFSNDFTTIDVIEFVGRNADYSDEEWDKAQTELGGKKSTNLTRLLASAAGRKHLGMSFKMVDGQKIPTLGTDPKWALSVLRRIVDDIVNGVVDSRRLNRASDIENYFKLFPQDLQPSDETIVSNAELFRNISLDGDQEKTPPKPTIKRKPAPRKRPMLAPKEHFFDCTGLTKLGMLVREAEQLNLNRVPFSAAFVLRTIVELSMNHYLDKHNLLQRNQDGSEFSLTKKVNSVIEDLKSNEIVSSSELQPFRVRLLSPSSACSIQSLNGFVHNQYALPSADDLRAGWDACVPLFIAIYGKV